MPKPYSLRWWFAITLIASLVLAFVLTFLDSKYAFMPIGNDPHHIIEFFGWTFFLFAFGLMSVLLLVRGEGKPMDAIKDRASYITLLALVSISLLTVQATIEVSPSGKLIIDPVELAGAGLLGVIAAVITLIGIQVFRFAESLTEIDKSVTDARSHLGDAQQEINTAKSSIVEVKQVIERVSNQLQLEVQGTAKASVQALSNALDVRRSLELGFERPNAATQVHHGLDALGAHYSSWATRLDASQKDKFERKAWLAAFPVVLRGEARNIQSKRIITDARNYCSLLLLTLADLLDDRPEEPLCYYQVTPVHPKDWYNWPHRRSGASSLYYENDFIGTYRRSLKAMLAQVATVEADYAAQPSKTRTQSRLEHGRFFMHAGTNTDSTSDVSGWALPRPEEFSDPAGAMLINASLQYETWPAESLCAFAPMLRSVAYKDVDRKPVVPLYQRRWTRMKPDNGIWDTLRTEANKHLSAEAGSCDCVKKILMAAKAAHSRTIADLKTQLIGVGNTDEEKAEIATLIEELANQPIQSIKSNFKQLLLRYNGVVCSLNLESSVVGHLEDLWSAVLRLWEAEEALEDQGDGRWANLFVTCAKELHTEAGAHIVEVDNEIAAKLNGIEGEFGIFGHRKVDGSIDWELVLATSLQFPFKVADIQVVSKDEGARFQAYETLIQEFMKPNGKSRPMGKEQLVAENR
jgi:hypothetical protein